MLLATGNALRLVPWVSTSIVGSYKKEIGGGMRGAKKQG